MSKPHLWHEVAVLIGGPLAMSFLSLGLAHIIEQGEGPVLPPITEPSASSSKRSNIERGGFQQAGFKDTSSSSQARRENDDYKKSNGNDSSAAMHLIFAFS